MNSLQRLLVTTLFLLFISSCSHYRGLESRRPANLSDDHYLSKFLEESARHILSFEPKKYGDYNSLMANPSELYKLIGKVDLNLESPVASRFTGREPGYRNLFDLSRVYQMSFQEWQRLKEDVVRTYLEGDYVFKKGNHYYTLSGLRLTKRVIKENLFYKANIIINDSLDLDRFVLDVFNRKTLHEIGDGRSFVLPVGHQVLPQNFDYLIKDFKSQVGESISVSPISLINYDKRKGLSELSDFTVYSAEKYKSFLHNEDLVDPEYACETKFYFRTLSRREDASRFIRTLLSHKARLMGELELSNNEYDELMQLALGILAVESKMGTSLKYKIKEDLRIGRLNLGQFAIKLIKRLKGRSDENSRGLTQIKDIGPLLEDSSYAYLEFSDLDRPENAALATMFVLKEKLGYLRHFSKRHTNITKENWADYLYYFYQGASSQVTQGLATPPLNLRIQKILEVKEDSLIFQKCQ